MLFLLRNLFGVVGRRNSLYNRIGASIVAPLPHNNMPFSLLPSSHFIICPLQCNLMIWVTGFFFIFRHPFSSKVNSDCFNDFFDRDSMKRLVLEERWNDFRIESLFDSALAPVLVSRVLVVLKEEPKLMVKLFRWAKTRIGFRHSTESYCIVIHVLFFNRMYHDAHLMFKEMILSSTPWPGLDLFDALWLTRNVCVTGYGVFDAFFSVLIELGMLEEANQCFERMKKYRVLPKVRSCNNLLRRLCESGRGDMSRKVFRNMIGAGMSPSVFTYNIMICDRCKDQDMVGAMALFVQMKENGLLPDIVTYNTLIDGHGKVGFLNETINVYAEMREVGCSPDVITYNTLINCFCKYEKLPQAFEFLCQMKSDGLKPNVVTYSTLIDSFCKEG